MPRIAIIGAAHPHVDYVLDELARADRGGFELVGVQDSDRAVAEKHAGRFGVPAYDRAEDLLAEGIDIAVIAGVYGTRGADVIAALRAGAHVLADKPLCTSLVELAQIEAEAASSGRTVNLLLEKRGYPETLAALAVVEAGELGDIVGITTSGPHKLNRAQRPDWFFDRAQYGGILSDLAVHDLDAALLFAPADEGVIRGAVSAPLDGAAGFACYGAATLTTPTTVISAEVSWLTPQASDVHGDYRLRLVGTRGTAEVFWARGRVEVTTQDRPVRLLDLPAGQRPAEEALDAFAAGRAPAVSTAVSLAATRLALLAQESADQGGAVLTWTRSADDVVPTVPTP
ncbi:Gfo/Idh/MocA family oxidoreductase [Microbacterium sp. SSW1-49]|uniref:Gfo/Idh/MocA family oxidoreductase n=1 Tax=Microbacterium croceum TaxID=2851645 RepID=A0ABT0FB04_9MICO|nr:Gfo/Idh/MocA family oxidoreductase [Microbacterium croceum]MCK2035248.1 Gfo/Idh/MocA family oxidoreductase [Microbacterium croceum]